MFFDRVKYTATQVSSVLFNVTVAGGFNELPTTATRASLYLIDSGGNYASIDGYRSGTQVHVNFIYESSENDNTMPTFGAGLEIYSTVGGNVLNNRLGTGGILLIGQSNGMGTEDSTKGPLDYVDSRILQWSTSNSGIILAEDPLEHYAAPDVGSVGLAMTAAKDLLNQEDHNKICLLPSCEGSTGFEEGQWVQGGYLYNHALAMANSFLAADPNNYLIAIIWSVGEDDAWTTLRSNLFEGRFDLATNNLRSDIVGNTRMPDASRVPVLATGMSEDWIPFFPSSAPTVQTALSTIGNRIPYSAFVSSTGATTQTELNNIHFDTAGYKLLGSRVPAALQLARGNTTGAATAPTGTVAETLGSFAPTASGSVVGAGGTVTGTAATNIDTFTSTASGGTAGAVTGTAATNIGAFVSSASGGLPLPEVDMQYNKGVGQTTGTPTEWANQGTYGATHDATQSTSAERPTFDSSGNVVFDGVDDQFDLPVAVLNNSTGYSIMARVKLNSTTGVFVGGSNSVFYIASGLLRSFNNGSGNLIEGTTTLNTGTWYKVFCTVDGSNNRQEIFLDGVSEGSLTQGTFSTSNSLCKIGMFNVSSLPLDGEISDLIIDHNVLSLADMNALTSGW